MKPSTLPRNIALSLASLLFCVLLLEAILALSGFDLPDSGYFRRDTRLGFVLEPGDYPDGVRINPDGFRGPDLRPRAPGRLRIVTLGDSCGFGVNLASDDETYSRRLETILAARGKDVEVINASVPGYTSFQGVFLLPLLDDLRPDAVTVYFGWNDHWLGGFLTDRGLATNPLLLGLHVIVSRSRSYHALGYLLGRRPNVKRQSVLGAPLAWLDEFLPDDRYRVPIEEYEENIREIAAWGRKRGVRIVFITAPDGLEPYGEADTVYRDQGRISKKDSVSAIHSSYNDRVRTVARASGSKLVDGRQILINHGNDFFLHPIIDPVHPDAEGHALIAEALADVLSDLRPRASLEEKRAARAEEALRKGIDWYLAGAEKLVCKDRWLRTSDPKYFWFMWRTAKLTGSFALEQFIKRAWEACARVDKRFQIYERLAPPGVPHRDFGIGSQVASGVHEDGLRWAVNCDRWTLTDATKARLMSSRYLIDHFGNRLNRKSYGLTHMLMAMMWLRDTEPSRGECVDPMLLRKHMHELASRLAWEHYTGLDTVGGYEGTRRRDEAGRARYAMQDITGQRIGTILEAGFPGMIRRAWLDHLIDAQNSDGGWSPNEGQPSSVHTSMCSLWALSLARYVYPVELGYEERQARADIQ